MANTSAKSLFERALPLLLLAMAGALFALQLRSLAVFPTPNATRWYGDETWLMTEAQQQIATGVISYPLAIGSQLEHGTWLALSMTWLSSFLYGLPVLMTGGDPILVGRCVTTALAVVLLLTLYFSSRQMGASRFAAAFCVVLLVSTRAFFFASHSTRPDLLAGLVVLLVVAFLTRALGRDIPRKNGWWFGYGAALAFLALSSSIHLVTLLGPVAIYYLWVGSAAKKGMTVLISVAGAVAMLILLALIYFCTTGSFTLFPASAQAGQFHDVLHAIPIFRPLSRSVQIANIVIRFKQFLAEAPAIFLLPVLLPFVKRRNHARPSLAAASAIVIVSWLLLEGAEVTYLIQMLPLLFLCLAMEVTRAITRWNKIWLAFSVIALLAFVVGIRDSNVALANGTSMERSNRSGTHVIEQWIASTWRGSGKPLVLTEPPTLERLSRDTSIRVMTDHFLSFPERVEPYDSFFAREQVNYAVLYNSPLYPKNRFLDDPFYEAVARSGNLIGRYMGKSGDIGGTYFEVSDWEDTILLFKLH